MTSQPAPNDIEGIALGEDYSVADKRRARTGKDLDERITLDVVVYPLDRPAESRSSVGRLFT